MARDWPPFGIRALLLIVLLGLGFSFLLVPEDFVLWLMLWAGYMATFAGVNVWRGRATLGVIAPTAGMACVLYRDPDHFGGPLTSAWIFMLLVAGFTHAIKAGRNGHSRASRAARDKDEVVAVAAQSHGTDASAADVLAHFGLENGGDQ